MIENVINDISNSQWGSRDVQIWWRKKINVTESKLSEISQGLEGVVRCDVLALKAK